MSQVHLGALALGVDDAKIVIVCKFACDPLLCVLVDLKLLDLVLCGNHLINLISFLGLLKNQINRIVDFQRRVLESVCSLEKLGYLCDLKAILSRLEKR